MLWSHIYYLEQTVYYFGCFATDYHFHLMLVIAMEILHLGQDWNIGLVAHGYVKGEDMANHSHSVT